MKLGIKAVPALWDEPRLVWVGQGTSLVAAPALSSSGRVFPLWWPPGWAHLSCLSRHTATMTSRLPRMAMRMTAEMKESSTIFSAMPKPSLELWRGEHREVKETKEKLQWHWRSGGGDSSPPQSLWAAHNNLSIHGHSHPSLPAAPGANPQHPRVPGQQEPPHTLQELIEESWTELGLIPDSPAQSLCTKMFLPSFHLNK